MNADTAYSRQQVETHDRDRYLLTLAAPPAARPALWALFAFNYELAKTGEITREKNAGHIRLTWWREALEGFYAGLPMPAHDVARALGVAITDYKLPQSAVLNLIDAREFDIENVAPASLTALVAYIESTNAPLIHLSALILGVKAPAPLACAYGMAGIIRALPFLARQNRCVLPLPILYGMNLMPEQFHHLTSGPALSSAIREMTMLAREHLDCCRSENRFFQKQIRMTDFYLRRIVSAGYDPFNPRICGPVPFLGFRI